MKRSYGSGRLYSVKHKSGGESWVRLLVGRLCAGEKEARPEAPRGQQ